MDQMFQTPGVDHQRLGGPALQELAARTDLVALMTEPELEGALRLVQEPLMRRLLTQTVVANRDLERLLTWLRRELLLQGHEGDPVLALQCWNNQFVWAVTPEEEERLSPDVPATMRACYGPVEDPPPALEERFLREPARERELRSGLQRLGPALDDVSARVASQYEEAPYPRYSSFERETPRSAAEVLAARLPDLTCELPDPCSVLVAGCGTGRHALNAATRYRGEVTALDLSAASLGYGMRMAEEAGLTNLTFLQGDLRLLEGRFDVIECIGVLHHMADPLEGLRALVRNLAPGGFLRLGFYSRAGRRCVAAARELRHGGLREFRRYLLGLDRGHPAYGVTEFQDFYSLAGARDLLDHAHELCFDLGQVGAMLEAAGLELVGFEPPAPGVFKAYSMLFPEDVRRTNLAYWSKFEELFPRTFRSMYQFWARRSTDQRLLGR